MFKNIIPPNKFVGLHAHSTFSTNDGLGYPSEHIDFVLSDPQGMDAWTLTDHGNGNGLAHAYSHFKKLKKLGRKYRQLYGVEFYFVPSLKEWKKDYNKSKLDSENEQTLSILNEVSEINSLTNDSEEESGGLILENEEESKQQTEKEIPEWKRRYHLVVIAKNRIGINNLFTLVKKSYRDGFFRYPRIDFELLKQHSEGLIVSTACIGGLLAGKIIGGNAKNLSNVEILNNLSNYTDKFVDAVGLENFFLELQFNKLEKQHLVNKFLLEHSKNTGIKLVTTADSHYPDPKKWLARELYKKMGWMGQKDQTLDLPKFEDLKCELYPKNAIQIWDEYQKYYDQYDFYNGTEEIVKDSIQRTHDIAWGLCEDTWIDQKVKLPNFNTPKKSEFNLLEEICWDELKNHNLHNKEIYVNRLKEELGDIEYLKNSSYFLTMYKVFNDSKDKTLLGPGRGSGCGSLVNYLLGITQIDPIPYGLLWNRFLGRHKTSWPDIDSDAGDRDVLINSARELFGEESVIPISNFNTLKLKSLVKDVAKFYNVPFEEVNALTATLQDEVMPHALTDDIEKSMFLLKHDDCMKYSQNYKNFMEKYPEVESQVSTLFMQIKSQGRHAGGVLIAPQEDIEKNIPIVSCRGEFQTPWTEGLTAKNLEDNGFLKFDFLGLTLLKDVENCIKRILQKQGIKNPKFCEIKDFFDKKLNCRFNNQDDQKVWKHVYHDAHFCGIFQMANEGARKFCVESKPTCIEDLAAITAIYRPGPLKANVDKKYVKFRKDPSQVKYEHPLIGKVLESTYGEIVFQEQFMILGQEIGGFTPGEADQMRKTLVKKSLDTLDKKSSEKELMRQKFVENAKNLHNIDEKISNDLFNKIEFFAAYGFNKSHAVAYAIDSYYSAWLHTYYEQEWLSTILDSANGNPDEQRKVISEIKSFGYKFSNVDINLSNLNWDFNIELNSFIPPLSSVKRIGKSAADEIICNRPYKSFFDLFYDEDGEWRNSRLNKGALEALAQIEGYFSLEEFKNGKVKNHRQIFNILNEGKNYDLLKKNIWGLTETKIKSAKRNGDKLIPILNSLLEKYSDLEDWNRADKILQSFEITGTADEELIFPSKWINKLNDKNVKSISFIKPETEDIAWFMPISIEVKTTKNKKQFYKTKVIDNTFKISNLRIWGVIEGFIPYTIWIGKVKYEKAWGMSTNSFNIKKII